MLFFIWHVILFLTELVKTFYDNKVYLTPYWEMKAPMGWFRVVFSVYSDDDFQIGEKLYIPYAHTILFNLHFELLTGFDRVCASIEKFQQMCNRKWVGTEIHFSLFFKKNLFFSPWKLWKDPVTSNTTMCSSWRFPKFVNRGDNSVVPQFPSGISIEYHLWCDAGLDAWTEGDRTENSTLLQLFLTQFNSNVYFVRDCL